MNEQTGIFLTDEEVLELADSLRDYAIAANLDWELGGRNNHRQSNRASSRNFN